MDDPDWILKVREWLKLCKQLAAKRRTPPAPIDRKEG